MICPPQKVFIKCALEGGRHYEVVCHHSVNTVRVVEEDTFLEKVEAEIAVIKREKHPW